MTMRRVVFVCGATGVGKTTAAEAVSKQHAGAVTHFDGAAWAKAASCGARDAFAEGYWGKITAGRVEERNAALCEGFYAAMLAAAWPGSGEGDVLITHPVLERAARDAIRKAAPAPAAPYFIIMNAPESVIAQRRPAEVDGTAAAELAVFAPKAEDESDAVDLPIDADTTVEAATRRLRARLGLVRPLEKYAAPTPSTAAAAAAAAGDIDALRAAAPEELARPDANGNTPLIWAVDQGREEAVAQLLSIPEVRAGVDHRGFLGATAVSRAARRGHAAIITHLATTGGADLDIPNDKEQYPLHFAAFKKHHAAVEALLAHNACTLTLDRKGRTPAEDTSDADIRRRILEVRAERRARL